MKLYRAFATVGGMTMLSRILGFLRDILIAAALGTGAIADAFFVAFRLPNLFRRLFGEGAFNSAFVPLFAKELEGSGAGAARKFAEESLAVLLFALLVFTALAELAMPWLMYVFAPGFADTPEKFDLGILLTRIMFPYLFCMSLVALLSGVLNALHKFASAAAAPVLLNVILIVTMAAAIWAGLGNTPKAGVLLAWGVAGAGALQLLVLAISAHRNGMGLGLRRPRMTPGVRRLIQLGIPGLIAGGITQLNILIGTIIASLQDGAVSYLYYADRIYQFPLGLVGVAMGVVLLPDIARQLRAGNDDGVRESQNRSLEMALLLTLPASVALFMVPDPIIRVLFERGAFTAADTAATSAALAAFACGLPAFVLIKVLSPAYFAREDTRTPMIYAGISMAVNVAVSLILFFVLKSFGKLPHIGIAIATSLSGWVNVALLWGTLKRRGHFPTDPQLERTVPLTLFASLAMGVVIWGLALLLGPYFSPQSGTLAQFSAMAFLVVSGLCAYGVIAHISGAANLARLVRGLIRK